MKSILIVCLLVIAVLAVKPFDRDELRFRKFVATYQKQYHSHEESQRRLAVFKTNLRSMEKLQSKNPEATYDVNEFSDLTKEEFAATHLMPKRDAAATCPWPYHQRVRPSAPAATAVTTFDWRTRGVVTPVKNQEQCGSCWSFSTTGNIEGQWAIATGLLISLSEQWIVDCSANCLQSNPQLCNGGCNGGLPWLAYEFIMSEKGIPSEHAVPYTGEDGNCTADVGPNVAAISGWNPVSTSVADIEQYLMERGPLSIAINADPLQSYNSGIINIPASECPINGMDHAVLLVGFVNNATDHYWIVKNSWATSWGENGYFRIAANGLCGTNLCVTSSLVTL